MGKLIGFVCSFVGATLLWWLALAYDRAPVGWPNVQVHVWGPINFTLHAPGAGAVTAANAKAQYADAQWGQCRANEKTLQAAIDAQNAAETARQQAGVVALSQAESALAASRTALTKAEKNRTSIMAASEGPGDVCVRMLATDQNFTDGLRQ